jgi:hypothetical protein
MFLWSVCVGETQRLRENGLMEEGKETKSFYRGPNVGVKWRPEFWRFCRHPWLSSDFEGGDFEVLVVIKVIRNVRRLGGENRQFRQNMASNA